MNEVIEAVERVKEKKQEEVAKIEQAIKLLEGVNDEIAITNNDSNYNVPIDNEEINKADEIGSGPFAEAYDVEKVEEESESDNAIQGPFNQAEESPSDNAIQGPFDEVEESASDNAIQGEVDEVEAAPESDDELEKPVPESDDAAKGPFDEEVANNKEIDEKKPTFIDNTLETIRDAFRPPEQAAGRRRNRKSRKGLRTKRFRGGKNRKTRRGRRNSRRVRK